MTSVFHSGSCRPLVVLLLALITWLCFTQAFANMHVPWCRAQLAIICSHCSFQTCVSCSCHLSLFFFRFSPRHCSVGLASEAPASSHWCHHIPEVVSTDSSTLSFFSFLLCLWVLVVAAHLGLPRLFEKAQLRTRRNGLLWSDLGNHLEQYGHQEDMIRLSVPLLELFMCYRSFSGSEPSSL